MTYIQILQLVITAGLFAGLWKVNRNINRWMDIATEYPPHRHVWENGTTIIIYPKGLEPGTEHRYEHGERKNKKLDL
jgi:hypothetical protein